MSDNPKTLRCIAARLYDGDAAKGKLEDDLSDAGVTFEEMGWDWYDNSLELYDVPPDQRLSTEARRIIFDAGFNVVYVNHSDKWETHYTFKGKEFAEVKGWRVSYPHKRGETEKSIWVEEVCETWPPEWFETGYAVVKP